MTLIWLSKIIFEIAHILLCWYFSKTSPNMGSLKFFFVSDYILCIMMIFCDNNRMNLCIMLVGAISLVTAAVEIFFYSRNRGKILDFKRLELIRKGSGKGVMKWNYMADKNLNFSNLFLNSLSLSQIFPVFRCNL